MRIILAKCLVCTIRVKAQLGGLIAAYVATKLLWLTLASQLCIACVISASQSICWNIAVPETTQR